jgi:hypothetical protein
VPTPPAGGRVVVVVEKNKKTTHLQLHVEYVNDMVESHLQYLSSGSHGRERREREVGGGILEGGGRTTGASKSRISRAWLKVNRVGARVFVAVVWRRNSQAIPFVR